VVELVIGVAAEVEPTLTHHKADTEAVEELVIVKEDEEDEVAVAVAREADVVESEEVVDEDVGSRPNQLDHPHQLLQHQHPVVTPDPFFRLFSRFPCSPRKVGLLVHLMVKVGRTARWPFFS